MVRATVAVELIQYNSVIVERYVGELGAAVDVTDGEYVGLTGAEVLVDRNGAVVADGDARGLQVEAGCHGTTAQRHQDAVGFHRCFAGPDAVVHCRLVDRGDVGRAHDAHSGLFQQFHGDRRDVVVFAAQNRRLPF